MAATIVLNGVPVDNSNAGFLSVSEDAIFELLRLQGGGFDREDLYVKVVITARKARKGDDGVDDPDAPDATVITLDDSLNAERGAAKPSDADKPRDKPGTKGVGTQETVMVEGPQSFSAKNGPVTKDENTQKRVFESNKKP